MPHGVTPKQLLVRKEKPLRVNLERQLARRDALPAVVARYTAAAAAAGAAAAAPAAAVVAPKPAAVQPGAVVTPPVQPSPPAAADQEAGLPGAVDRLRERLQSLFG